MSHPDTLLQVLSEANPAPVRPVESKLSADEMLERVRERRTERVGAAVATTRNVAFAIAGFAAAAIAVGIVSVVSFRGEAPVTPTTVPVTSSTTTSTSAGSTNQSLDPAVQGVLDAFAARYTAGDVMGIAELLAPGVTKTTARDHEPTHYWDLDTALYQISIDAALNTTFTFEGCRALQSGSVNCQAVRSNDLTRIAGVGPQVESVTMRAVDGLITVWLERQGVTATPYQLAAIEPFTSWLAEAHPEIPNPHPLGGGISHWQPRFEIIDRLAELVAEYASDVASDGE